MIQHVMTCEASSRYSLDGGDLSEELSRTRVAEQPGVSALHFTRPFERAT
jgi:hypothetical protein